MSFGFGIPVKMSAPDLNAAFMGPAKSVAQLEGNVMPFVALSVTAGAVNSFSNALSGNNNTNPAVN